MNAKKFRAYSALMGVSAAAVVLAVAELVALVFLAGGSPLFAVGSLVIDGAPSWVKTLVIDLFGAGDKAFLLTLLGMLILVGATVAGILEARRPPLGVAVFALATLIAVVAVVTRSGSSGLNGVPTILGAVCGVVVLRLGVQRFAAWSGEEHRRAQATVPAATVPVASAPAPSALTIGGPPLERRKFLLFAIVSGAASVIIIAGARALTTAAPAVTALRKALTLPVAATPAAAIPAGAALDIGEITPLVTPNADFYRIDTALQVPAINPDTWSLEITGLVKNPIKITLAELLAKPLVEHYATLACVSNEVGGNLIGNALWLGYPIRELLKLAQPLSGADMVLSTSSDGFTAGTPLSVLQDEDTQALLAVGMNGVALPLEHGFPVRMVVPGLYGYVSATKWVVSLEVTKFAESEGYWTPRGWNALGPVKLQSRIDTPAAGAKVGAGMVAVAGVAWSQHVGVSKVEVQIDDGPWVVAELAESISADTWRQWVYRWQATVGQHKIQVRATDARGQTQSAVPRPVDPNGAEGYDSATVSVK